MTTQTKRSARLPEAATGDRVPVFAELWQVPVFLLGLAALLGVWCARPLWYDPEARHIDRSLSRSREILAKPHPQVDRALELALEVCRRTEMSPSQLGEAHYLAGSAYLRQASAVGSQERSGLLQQARTHLEQAETLGVPESDQLTLTYRLGLAWSYTGVDPARVIASLSRSIDLVNDDRAEGYSVLTDAYLRLPAPDLSAALAANQRQLDLPTDNENLLAPARLLRGELLLQSRQRAEARRVLARIGPGAPRPIVARARQLRAQSYQEDQAWEEAARLWEEVLKERRQSPAEPNQVLYALGICYRHLGRPDDASRAWDGVVLEGKETGQAAAVRLADLRLEEGNSRVALELYDRALRNSNRPEEWRNPYLALAEVRQLLESGCQRLRETAKYDEGRLLVEIAARLAEPFRGQLLLAQLAEAHAAKELELANEAGLGNAAQPFHQEQARKHFREAGTAYQRGADLSEKPSAQTSWLRASARCLLSGQDYDAAVAVLRQLVKDLSDPDQLGEAWYRLAEAYQALGQHYTADAFFEKCIEYPSPFAFRARFNLAVNRVELGHLDEAEEILKQNLELMLDKPDRETHERSLYALAAVLFQRQNYRLAAQRFQEALEHYPENPGALTARSQLAQCYMQLAEQESKNLRPGQPVSVEAESHYRAQRGAWLKKAAEANQEVIDRLLSREAVVLLLESDARLLGQSLFALAECRFDSAHYVEALKVYEILASRLEGRYEQLVALRGMLRCHNIDAQPDKARATLKRIQAALSSLDDGVFLGRPEPDSRVGWEQWIGGQSELLKNL